MYGEGIRGMGQEPGFMVVKKNEVSESAEDEPITDLNVKEWEVRSAQLKWVPHFAEGVVLFQATKTWIKYSSHYDLIHNL